MVLDMCLNCDYPAHATSVIERDCSVEVRYACPHCGSRHWTMYHRLYFSGREGKRRMNFLLRNLVDTEGWPVSVIYRYGSKFTKDGVYIRELGWLTWPEYFQLWSLLVERAANEPNHPMSKEILGCARRLALAIIDRLLEDYPND